MRIEQRTWRSNRGWSTTRPDAAGIAATGGDRLVLLFGGRHAIEDPQRIDELRDAYPGAVLFGCSTAGEIHGTRVEDDTLVATAVGFAGTRLRLARTPVDGPAGSLAAGARLGAELAGPDLGHVIVLSDGLLVNGSELVRGLTGALPREVGVTGGLSADGTRFERTLVCADGVPGDRLVAALGLYGTGLKVGYGSLGGWDPFGPERLVTRASGNVLYELDGQSALELYRKYLGEHAAELPSSGLLFPLSVRSPEGGPGVVRTILGIDEAASSVTFAGDIPQGSLARLMKANFERLIDGATGAARACHERLGEHSPDLALLISCVGRKLVLGQRVEEEVESVSEVLGARTALTGFYSYGEIAPFVPSAGCELHNQTMTITTLAERA